MIDYGKKLLKIRHLELCLQVTSEAFAVSKIFDIFFVFWRDAPLTPQIGEKKAPEGAF